MGRRSHSQTLTLWANGEYVGRWTITARGDTELQYDAGWLASPRGRPLSLSLPFNLNNESHRIILWLPGEELDDRLGELGTWMFDYLQGL